MRFCLALAATACLLAFSNAASITITGKSSQSWSVDNDSCVDVSGMDLPTLQVLVEGGSAKLFRNSGCESLIKSVLDKYYYDGDAVSVNGPIKSFRLTIDNHRNPGASKA